MDKTDNKNLENNESRNLRTITADSNNSSYKSRNNSGDDSGLEFEFDFMRKQTGLHPETRGVSSDAKNKNRGLEPTIVYGENRGLVPQQIDSKATRDTIDFDATQVYQIRSAAGDTGSDEPSFNWRDTTQEYDIRNDTIEMEPVASAGGKHEAVHPDKYVGRHSRPIDLDEILAAERALEEAEKECAEQENAVQEETAPAPAPEVPAVEELPETEQPETLEPEIEEPEEQEIQQPEIEEPEELPEETETESAIAATEEETEAEEDVIEKVFDTTAASEEVAEESAEASVDEDVTEESDAAVAAPLYAIVNKKGLSGIVKQEKKPNVKAVSAYKGPKKAAKSASKNSSGQKQSAGADSKKKNTGNNNNNNNNNNQNKKPKKEKKKKVRKHRSKFVIFFRTLILTLIALFIIGGIAGVGYTAYIISHADPIYPDKIYENLAVSSYIYDDKDVLIDEIYYNENRQITKYEQLPDDLKNAFIAIEDKTFWTHKGFNFRRIFGAILERFQGGRISGTSTITQQLARNVFLPDEKSERSVKRKITEMYYAYLIEQELSKEDILTAYLNTIYLGYGCYGVDTASRTYFGVPVEELTLEMCAALAALPQAPGSYQLIVSEEGENTTKIKKGMYANDASRDRRYLVLALMEEQGYITAEQREAATKPLEEFIKPGSTAGKSSTSAFKDYLLETVKNDLMSAFELTDEQATKLIYTKGLRIYSTLDSQAQKVITKEFKDSDNFPSTKKKGVEPEAAMVITEVGTGKIKAMVGTRHSDAQMLFNRAVNPRQPGSSIKPLTVYAPALQRSYEYQKDGKTYKFKKTGYDKQGTSGWGSYITVSSTVTDEKMKVNGKTWPLNVTRSYSGHNTFRSAIQKSINTCAVKILAQVGTDYSMKMLKKFGITTAIDDTSEPYNDLNYAALALGAMTEGVSPLEMSIAYAAFPNKGKVNKPICYTRVEDSDGRVLLEPHIEETRVMNEGVAWIMTNVLQSVVTNGIGSPAAVKGIKVGGKTGTTDSRYDIWFDGFTPSYSAALWIGTDNNVQMDSMSEKAAALWSKIMGQVKKAKKGEYPGMPKNVFRAWNGEFYTNGTAPPEPEPEPEEEEEEEGKKGEEAKPGDTNKDGKVTIQDIIPGANQSKPDSNKEDKGKKKDKKD